MGGLRGVSGFLNLWFLRLRVWVFVSFWGLVGYFCCGEEEILVVVWVRSMGFRWFAFVVRVGGGGV